MLGDNYVSIPGGSSRTNSLVAADSDSRLATRDQGDSRPRIKMTQAEPTASRDRIRLSDMSKYSSLQSFYEFSQTNTNPDDRRQYLAWKLTQPMGWAQGRPKAKGRPEAAARPKDHL